MKSLTAINDWVFIRRDECKTEFNDMIVSERLAVKNPLGVVSSVSSSYKNVTKVGDRVHVPHIEVQDFVIDGEEYAVCKARDLFAQEVDGTFQPINSYVRVRKCMEDHIRDEDENVLLHMTDEHLETTNWVEIIDVADDCKYVTKEDVGKFIAAPETDNRLCRMLYTKDYFLHEDLVEWVTDGD